MRQDNDDQPNDLNDELRADYDETTLAHGVRGKFVQRRQPQRLLLVSTGNIRNADLEALFFSQIAAIEEALSASDFVELTREAISHRT